MMFILRSNYYRSLCLTGLVADTGHETQPVLHDSEANVVQLSASVLVHMKTTPQISEFKHNSKVKQPTSPSKKVTVCPHFEMNLT